MKDEVLRKIYVIFTIFNSFLRIFYVSFTRFRCLFLPTTSFSVLGVVGMFCVLCMAKKLREIKGGRRGRRKREAFFTFNNNHNLGSVFTMIQTFFARVCGGDILSPLCFRRVLPPFSLAPLPVLMYTPREIQRKASLPGHSHRFSPDYCWVC